MPLAEAGIDVLSFNNRYVNSAAGTELVTRWEEIALDVAAAVAFARDTGYENIVLYGHSAGGPQMAYYQAVAERHVELSRRERTLLRFDGYQHPDGSQMDLPPADGIISSAATIGTGASFLLRIDGSILDEDSGRRDPSLDMYAASNGFDDTTGAGSYSRQFLIEYRAAQAERMGRLISRANAMLEQSGDQDPPVMVIRGTRADPKAVDLSLARTTEGTFRLEPEGRAQRIESTRLLRATEHVCNRQLDGMAVHLATSFLSYRAIRPTDAYSASASGISLEGMDYDSVNTSMPGNLDKVTVPVLVLQGTSDSNPQLPSAEQNYLTAAGSSDRELVFISGAEHGFMPTANSFGDTRGVSVEVMKDWIDVHFN